MKAELKQSQNVHLVTLMLEKSHGMAHGASVRRSNMNAEVTQIPGGNEGSTNPSHRVGTAQRSSAWPLATKTL